MIPAYAVQTSRGWHVFCTVCGPIPGAYDGACAERAAQALAERHPCVTAMPLAARRPRRARRLAERVHPHSHCADCRRPTWSSGNPPPEHIRQALKAAGWRRSGGRGLCGTCYVRHSNHGTLDRYAAVRAAAGVPCARCGVPARSSGFDVCRDCADVLHDLGELGAWRAVS